jgi:hypothetical protein
MFFLGNLIRAMREKSKSEVVALIDEYDAPVAGNTARPKIARANAEVLHTFFIERCGRSSFDPLFLG